MTYQQGFVIGMVGAIIAWVLLTGQLSFASSPEMTKALADGVVRVMAYLALAMTGLGAVMRKAPFGTMNSGFVFGFGFLFSMFSVMAGALP